MGNVGCSGDHATMLLRRRLEDLPIGTHVGAYTVHKRVGDGPTAVVYQVTHRALGSVHAMKVLTVASCDARRRLEREGMVASMLRHRNVVSVTDLVFVGGVPALIQEYVSGPTLAAWLSEARPSAAEARRLFLGIVDGVAHAHEQGVTHGDLNPRNILLAPEREGLEPRVADFGVHGLLADPETGLPGSESPIGLGTAEYAPPEQLRCPAQVTSPADVFSLGCILYELLAGQPAFCADRVPELFSTMVRGSYRPLPANTPRDLADVVHRCLRPVPEQRPASALALLQRLRQRPWPAGLHPETAL